MTVPDWLLRQVATVELGLLLLGWLVLFSAGVWRTLQRARERRVVEARDAVTAGLLTGGLPAHRWEQLERLRHGEREQVLAALAPSLRGRERAWLGEVAVRLGLVGRGERLSRSRLWWRRLRGARVLTLAGAAGEAVLGRARDPNPLVRSQVAEWCAANPTPAAVRTLVTMLGDPHRASRFAVQDALARLGEAAVEPLRARLLELGAREERAEDGTEVMSALAVARALGDGRLTGAILALSHHGHARVRQSAYRALGSAGGAEAAGRLEEGLDDRYAPARAAAAEALGAMGHWAGARKLAERLGDSSWDVRSAAGTALVRLGPPGELLLRRALRSEDRFVADMARHAMDTAAVRGGP